MSLSVREERDAALDNLKGLLIISVVYVHIYDMLGQETPLLYILRLIILAVQMPLFVFLCGYFGKNLEKRRREAIPEYLIPFFVCNLLYYLIRVDQIPGLKFGLLRPLNMYWFLMTLLLIRLLMPELVRIRGLLPLSIVGALLAGGDKYIGRTLSLSRTICFFPFYLMGYYCSEKMLKRIRQLPIPVVLFGGAVGAYLTIWLTETLQPDPKRSHPFQLVNSYQTQGLEPLEGIQFRLAIYIAAPLLGMMLLRLISTGKSVLTRIGRGSMTVYLLHAFPLLWMVECWEDITAVITKIFPALAQYEAPMELLGGVPQLLFFALYAVAVAWLLSSRPVVQIYQYLLQKMKHALFC